MCMCAGRICSRRSGSSPRTWRASLGRWCSRTPAGPSKCPPARGRPCGHPPLQRLARWLRAVPLLCPSLGLSALEWPSPRRGLREAAASLWGLPSVADPTAFGHVGRGRMRSSPRWRSGCRPLRRRPSLRARRDYGTLYVPTGLSSSVVTCCTLDSNKLKMWRPQPESFLYKGLFHDWCGRDCSLW